MGRRRAEARVTPCVFGTKKPTPFPPGIRLSTSRIPVRAPIGATADERQARLCRGAYAAHALTFRAVVGLSILDSMLRIRRSPSDIDAKHTAAIAAGLLEITCGQRVVLGLQAGIRHFDLHSGAGYSWELPWGRERALKSSQAAASPSRAQRATADCGRRTKVLPRPRPASRVKQEERCKPSR